MGDYGIQYVIWLDGVLFYQTKDREEAQKFKQFLTELNLDFKYEERLL